jgi:phosphoribosylformylglycinamidine cyclo-ligase
MSTEQDLPPAAAETPSDDAAAPSNDAGTKTPSNVAAAPSGDAAANSAAISSQITYADAGVNINEGARAVDAIKAAVRTTYTPDVIGDLGGFGALYSAASLLQMKDPVLVSGTDGVGTKLELAKRLGIHDSIGIDLVAMCVNDIVTCGAKPLFFLDYLAVGKLDADFAATVVGGIAEGCRQAGCALIGGEMAEHPGVMATDSYDLSGFAVGVVDRGDMLGPNRVVSGDQLLLLTSSGLHSNGYSLVRRALTDKMSDDQLACATLPAGSSLAKALLAPTRIYVDEVLAAAATGGLHAAAHITGGGISENLNRVLPAGLDACINSGWEIPAVILEVIRAAGLSQAEALKTFNMGAGMILVVNCKLIEEVTRAIHDSWRTRGYQAKEYDLALIGEIKYSQDKNAPGEVICDIDLY